MFVCMPNGLCVCTVAQVCILLCRLEPSNKGQWGHDEICYVSIFVGAGVSGARRLRSSGERVQVRRRLASRAWLLYSTCV
jgi:hypothetical protein